MSTFSHILFATNGSKSSTKALDYLKEMVEKFHSKVTIVNVFELPVMFSYEIYTDIYSQVIKILEEDSIILLESIKKEIPSSSVETISLHGDAGFLVTNTALEKECDLIIIGAHESDIVKNFLISSVSNYVIHHAKCPLLII